MIPSTPDSSSPLPWGQAHKKEKDQATWPLTLIDVQDQVDREGWVWMVRRQVVTLVAHWQSRWHRPGWSTRGGNAPCQGARRFEVTLGQVDVSPLSWTSGPADKEHNNASRLSPRRVFAPWEEGLGQCRTMDQETDTANNINFPMAPRHYYSVLGQLWIRGSDGLILSGFFFFFPHFFFLFSFFTGSEGQIITRWFLRESRQRFWKSLFRSACKSIIGRKSSCVVPWYPLFWTLSYFCCDLSLRDACFLKGNLGRLFKMLCLINGKIIG